MRNAAFLFALFALLTAAAYGLNLQFSNKMVMQAGHSHVSSFDPADFTHVISNRYYTRTPGMYAAYEKETARGTLRKAILVTGETKTVMGVTTLVVRDRVWLNDHLLEDTNNWLAQDKDGTVWYFGEAIDHYRNGKLVSHDGSWEAGVDGARPGVMMVNQPRPGDPFRQEIYPGGAEDKGTVIEVGVSYRVPNGPSFSDCVHTRDWTPLEDQGPLDVSQASAEKYFCVGVGVMVAEAIGSELLTLVSYSDRPTHEDGRMNGGGRLASLSLPARQAALRRHFPDVALEP